MDEKEFSLVVKSLLLKVHVITGWEIPQGELMKILVDQFGKKLKESYYDLNSDEIEYAFRHSFIEDWGKSMNIKLIDEVLSEYIIERKRIGHEVEERNAKPPEQKLYTDQEMEDQQRGDIEAFFQRCRKGIVPNGIPTYFETILKKDGLLKKETVAEFLTRRLGDGSKGIYIKS